MPRSVGLPANGLRHVLVITWSLAFACMLAVAVSSRTVGRPVWWLGPTTDPAPVVALLVPIVVIATPVTAALRSWREPVLVSTVCSLLLALTALPDAPDRMSLAIATWTVALATLLANIGVMVARRHYR